MSTWDSSHASSLITHHSQLITFDGISRINPSIESAGEWANERVSLVDQRARHTGG